MGKFLTSVPENEKNRILEMYGIQKHILSEQRTPPYNLQVGGTVTIKLTPGPGNLVKLKIDRVRSRTSFENSRWGVHEIVNNNFLRRAGMIMEYPIVQVDPPGRSTPPPPPRTTTPPTPKAVPLPKELANQRINFFLCPDYDPNLSQKALDSILITKLEEVFPDDDIVGKSMEDRVGSFVKLTTNRKLVGGTPLILYFICGYDGFATNHDGFRYDDFNVLITKFEGGRYAERCNKPQTTPDKTPAGTEEMKKRIDTIRQPINLPQPNPNPKPGLREGEEDEGGTGIPTRVFSNTLHDFLTNKYCGKSWSQGGQEENPYAGEA